MRQKLRRCDKREDSKNKGRRPFGGWGVGAEFSPTGKYVPMKLAVKIPLQNRRVCFHRHYLFTNA